MSCRRMALFTLALMVCVSLVAHAADAPPAEKKYGKEVGNFVKPVELSTLDGAKKVDVSALPKKTVFVLVSSVCTTCGRELREISANIKELSAKMDVYGVLIDMDPKAGGARMAKSEFPILADPEFTLGNAVDLTSTPSTVVIDTDGKIAYRKSGYERDQWKELLTK